MAPLVGESHYPFEFRDEALAAAREFESSVVVNHADHNRDNPQLFNAYDMV